MATWYSLEMVADDSAKTTMQRIMDAFTPKYIGSGRPIDMAIFSSYDSVENTITLYFSPKAASLAMQFGAMPCDSEFVDVELSLLVGDDGSIDALFPNADQ